MKRDSFIFYRSFYQALLPLSKRTQMEALLALLRYALDGEESEHLSPVVQSVFTLIKPQLDANNQRFENGRKGGAPKGNRNALKKQPNQNLKQPNVNDNANDNINNNANINDNINTNTNDNINDSLSFFCKKKQKKECVSPENFFQKENSFLEAPLNDSSEEEKKEKEKISAQKEKEAQKKETSFDFRAAMLAEGFAPDLVDEWLKIRKAKKAINSEHAFELFLEQVQLTQQEKNTILKLIVQKQWKGFEASWLETLSHPSLNRKEPITIDQNGNILNPTYFNTTSTNTSPYVAGRQTAETLRANLQGW